VLGYNATVMAYGPTGSGKSYTLGTSNAEVNFYAKNLCLILLFV
jgi:type II secretory ATPase GspE/PulE/Tfp pilus assembly ATPase PilB-like protein